MNQFIYDYDESLEFEGGFISEADESELIEHILDNSEYTTIEQFALSNVSYEDALNLVQSTDSFSDDVAEWLTHQPTGMSDQFAEHLLEAPKAIESVAYSLAYTHSELGTKLLDELLHYRSIGRI